VTAGWRAFNISSDKATGIGGWRGNFFQVLKADCVVLFPP
jgi:hypothetical protein